MYGINQKTNFVISKFVNQILNSKNLYVFGMVNKSDLFVMLRTREGLLLIIRKGKKNGIYNVGNNREPISILNLAKKIKKLSASKTKILKIDFKKSDWTKEREIFKRYPDLTKIKRHTGYIPEISLDDGIKKLLKKDEF